MIGDFLTSGGTQLTIRPLVPPVDEPLGVIDMTIGGGAGRVKIADNNKALTQNRMYFNYNYFENPLQVAPGSLIGGAARQLSVSRYTVGFEKTLFCDVHSLELRLPFNGTYDFAAPNFGVLAENADNLTIIYKYLLEIGGMDETGSAVVGLGVNVPTGADIQGRFFDHSFRIENEAVHLLPYLGFLGAEDATFFQLFLQFDVAAGGNPIQVQPVGAVAPIERGTLNEQNLFYFDVALGRWLFPDCCTPIAGISGVAAILELHYATTLLQSTDQVIAPNVDTTTLEFSSVANRFDIVNVTMGLHFEFGSHLNMSLATALPLRDAPNRSYDAQILGQLNYQF
jgi:hypothetical protein